MEWVDREIFQMFIPWAIHEIYDERKNMKNFIVLFDTFNGLSMHVVRNTFLLKSKKTNFKGLL